MGASFVCIVSFCARDINVGGGVRFKGWLRFFMGAMLLVGLYIWNRFWGRYCMDTSVVVCCHNSESAVFLVRYFINAALLVMIHISRTQKWAGGHTVPSRYVCVCEFIKLNEVTVVEIFHGDIFLYFMFSALLMIIHITCTQNWAGGHTVPSRYGCVHINIQ